MPSSSSPFGSHHHLEQQQQQSNLTNIIPNHPPTSVISHISNTSFTLKPLPHIVRIRPHRFTLPAPVHLKINSANMQRARFWNTVLNVTDPRELSPGSSVSTDLSSKHHSPVPEMKIPRGIGTAGLQVDTLNQLAAADLRRNRRHRSPRKGARLGPFLCNVCNSSFGQRGDLMRHIRVTHLGERNYHCNVCSMSFGRRSILNKHLKRHERDGAVTIRPSTSAVTSARGSRSNRSSKKSTDAADVLMDIMRDHRC